MLPSGIGPSSTLRPGRRFEWATLSLNSRSGVRPRQERAAPVERPVGEAGSAYQKPKPSEPAAALPRIVLSGLVIQNVAARLSVGQHALGGAVRPQAEIAGDQVAGLGSVLEEVAVAQVVVADIALDPGVVGAVHRHAAVEALPELFRAKYCPSTGPIMCQCIG